MTNKQKIALGSIIAVAILVAGLILTYNPVTNLTTIAWDSSKITSPDVEIAIIRQINTNPYTFELVRLIATTTPNDGSYDVEILDTDKVGETYIEVGCAISPQACQASNIIAI